MLGMFNNQRNEEESHNKWKGNISHSIEFLKLQQMILPNVAKCVEQPKFLCIFVEIVK